MRISYKLIVLVLCALVSTSFAAAKPAKEAPMKAKDANAPAMPAVKPAPAEAPAATPKVQPAAPKAEVEPKVAENTEVAATVNGTNITEGDIDARLKPMLDKRMGKMDPNMAEQYKKQMKWRMLDAMISERLLDEQVKKNNVIISDSDVNDKITDMTKQQGISPDMLKSLLASQGRDYDQFVQQVKKEMGYEKLFEGQAGAVEVNDADALAYYEKNKDSFNVQEQVKASHILVKVSPSATTEEKAAAKEKADKLLKQVKAGGDFAEIAKENSDCPSKVKGGDLGFFEKGQMVKEFEDAAFGMQPGQVSDVVETQFGYHIIKVTDRKAAGVTTFEEAKPDIMKGLKQMKLGKLSREYLEKLKSEAKIVYPAGKEPQPMMMPPRTMEMAPPPPK